MSNMYTGLILMQKKKKTIIKYKTKILLYICVCIRECQ